MLFLVPSALEQKLHATNSRLRFWLDSFIPDHTRHASATPEQMNGLLAELMQAGQWLRSMPPERVPELEHELEEYRRNVERLRELLPSIHGALLQQRRRFEEDRARLETAAQWAQGSRQTL